MTFGKRVVRLLGALLEKSVELWKFNRDALQGTPRGAMSGTSYFARQLLIS
jgi:hypothetical protein